MTNSKTIFNTEVDLDTLIQHRNEAYSAYCEYLELYGENNQDTIDLEQEYWAIEELIDQAELV